MFYTMLLRILLGLKAAEDYQLIKSCHTYIPNFTISTINSNICTVFVFYYEPITFNLFLTSLSAIFSNYGLRLFACSSISLIFESV